MRINRKLLPVVILAGISACFAQASGPRWLQQVYADFRENSVRSDSISGYRDTDGIWLRFTLSSTDPVLYVHRRAEMARKFWEFNGSEALYRLTVRVPEQWAWTDTTTAVVQWHPGSRPAGENRVPPPLGLAIRGDRWTVISKHDDNPDTLPPWKEHILHESVVERGVPVVGEFHVRWDWGPGGFITIRKNGQVVYEGKGPNAFNFNQGAGGVHMMFGLMKPLPQWGEGEHRRMLDIRDVGVTVYSDPHDPGRKQAPDHHSR